MTGHWDWATAVGLIGMALIVGAYAYLTWKDEPNPFVLHGTNLIGAALLAVSLLVHMNLPSLVLEGFWAAIALFGLGKALLSRKEKRRERSL